MVKTEYISKLNNLNKINEVYSHCKSLHLYYPGFNSWFLNKVWNGVINNERIIVVKRFNQEFAGFAILKNNQEKKICTLKIIDKYKSKGIGDELLYNSLEFLKCEKPIITVSESKVNEFLPLLRNYNFELKSCLDSFYNEGDNEYCFNGILKPESNIKKSEEYFTIRKTYIWQSNIKQY